MPCGKQGRDGDQECQQVWCINVWCIRVCVSYEWDFERFGCKKRERECRGKGARSGRRTKTELTATVDPFLPTPPAWMALSTCDNARQPPTTVIAVIEVHISMLPKI